MTTFLFRTGARVRLTAFANRYYGGNTQWCPESQGGGTDGTVVIAEDRPHDYAADARPKYPYDALRHQRHPESTHNVTRKAPDAGPCYCFQYLRIGTGCAISRCRG